MGNRKIRTPQKNGVSAESLNFLSIIISTILVPSGGG